MDECFKCGITADKVRLFDAISSEGIVKICRDCSEGEDIPIIKKPTTFQLKESERKSSVYERLSRAAGLDFEKPRRSVDAERQDVSLREIVDRNFKSSLPAEKKPRPDLVENFHWIIMRARRMKKLTQEQLAKEIGEAVSAISMAEQGVLPEDDYRLINKLERFLDIPLIRKEVVEEIKEIERKQPVRILDFKEDSVSGITIDDLRKIKRQREEELVEPEDVPREALEYEAGKFEVNPKAREGEPEFVSKEEEELKRKIEAQLKAQGGELSDKDLNDIIFGRK